MIRNRDIAAAENYMLASMLARRIVVNGIVEQEAADMAAISARNELRKDVLSVMSPMMAFAVICWPLLAV